MGDNFASKLAVETYNENFLDLIETVGEQEIINWIMHNFIKLEVNAARESADDKIKAMSGASIAGQLFSARGDLLQRRDLHRTAR